MEISTYEAHVVYLCGPSSWIHGSQLASCSMVDESHASRLCLIGAML